MKTFADAHQILRKKYWTLFRKARRVVWLFHIPDV